MEKVTSSVGARVATLYLWGARHAGPLYHPGGSRMWVWGFDLYEGTC